MMELLQERAKDMLYEYHFLNLTSDYNKLPNKVTNIKYVGYFFESFWLCQKANFREYLLIIVNIWKVKEISYL